MHRRLTAALCVLSAVALICLAALDAGSPTAARAARAAAPLVVSVEFDDTIANQYQALAMLNETKTHATFFAISGLLDHGRYMSTRQLLALQAAGNEIGGHTIDHPHLSRLSVPLQRVEICNDRETLLQRGLRITDIAYPYGDHSAATERVAADCGYNSGREDTGLSCASRCVPAETIPPADRYATRDYPTVLSTTVKRMESVVGAAKRGGGWVQIVFHNVCVPGAGCMSKDTTKPSDLRSFLRWLAAQRAAGKLTVKTVAQVIGGPVKAAVHAPMAGPAALVNPSLESGTGPLPTCWIAAGYGTRHATVTRTTDAHSGTRAVQIAVTAAGTGDVKLLSAEDGGLCSPPVHPGSRYVLSTFYRSATTPHLIAYYRDRAGNWVYFAKSPPLAASAAYTQGSWETPAFPADAEEISIGVMVDHVGSATVDDLAFRLADGTPAKRQP